MRILQPLIWLRNRISKRMTKSYADKMTDWQPPQPISAYALASYCVNHMEWISDPLHGLLDHIQPVEHMNWQLKNTGKLKGDCDDLATWVAYMLKRMGYPVVYRVNIVKYRHVICVFRYADKQFKLFSNQHLYVGDSKSVAKAVDHWCDKHYKKHTKVYYAERI